MPKYRKEFDRQSYSADAEFRFAQALAFREMIAECEKQMGESITQGELAVALGCSPSHVCQILSGRYNASWEFYEDLTRMTGFEVTGVRETRVDGVSYKVLTISPIRQGRVGRKPKAIREIFYNSERGAKILTLRKTS